MEYKERVITFPDTPFTREELIEMVKKGWDENSSLLAKYEMLEKELKASRRSEKTMFEEQDKQIQSLKEDKKLHIQDFERQRKAIIELEDEVSRLKGKVKEAWQAAHNYYFQLWGHKVKVITAPDKDQWFKENNILE